MKITGIKPESMIEWPGHLSSVIFIAGCNFRCPFCFVPNLVFEKGENINEKEILNNIKERKNFIDGICITGGEPTIHPQLPAFLKKIKNMGLKIRIETNGSKPKLLKKLMKNKLIDSLALDIKNCKEKYNETSGTDVDIENIKKTIKLIKDSGLDYEFRTTLVPGLHNKDDIKKIAEWTGRAKLYVLQQFRSDLPEEKTLNQEYTEKTNFPIEELQNIKKQLENLGFFEKIEIRS